MFRFFRESLAHLLHSLTSQTRTEGQQGGDPRVDDSRAGPARAGLTLEKAIELLVSRNLELLAAAEDLKQSGGDVITAGLRSNPQLVPTAQYIPYGSYASYKSSTEGGPARYYTQVVVPLDLAGKRRARVTGSKIGVLVAEALYNDAVRKQIDNLYTAFVDALAAQETLDQLDSIDADLRKRAQNVEDAKKNAERQGKQQDAVASRERQAKQENYFNIYLREETTSPARRYAKAALQEKMRTLADLLNINFDESLRVQGTLLDCLPPPLLVSLALSSRPDLRSLRHAVERARADAHTVRANRFEDVILTYTPYVFPDAEPYKDKLGVTSWGLAANIPTPIFNRQQGNIVKADSLVVQARLRLAAAERDVGATFGPPASSTTTQTIS